MGYGVNTDDIEAFSRFMQKTNHLDSFDEKGRSAVFLEFRKK
jgi:hypothetical protein